MDSPKPRVLSAFRNEFHNVGLFRRSFPTLGGHGSFVLNDKHDLMALCQQPEEDLLTKFLRNYLPSLFVVCLIPMRNLSRRTEHLTNDKLTRFEGQIAPWHMLLNGE